MQNQLASSASSTLLTCCKIPPKHFLRNFIASSPANRIHLLKCNLAFVPISKQFNDLWFADLLTLISNRSWPVLRSSLALDWLFFLMNFFIKFVNKANIPTYSLWIIGWSNWNSSKNYSKASAQNAQKDK